MRISIKNRLFFELESARILAITTDVHVPMMITIYFAKDKIINCSRDLGENKRITINNYLEFNINTYNMKLRKLFPPFSFIRKKFDFTLIKLSYF